MSSDPTIPLLRKLLAFLQTKEVIDFFGRMEERIVSESMDANPSTGSTAVQENVDYCSLPFHERHKVAAAVLNLSRGENSSPFTRAKARRVRLAGPQRQPKLLPRMYRRFLKSRGIDGGQKETDPEVNIVGPDGVRRELGCAPVVSQVPETMLEEEDDGSGLDVNLGNLEQMGCVEEAGGHDINSGPKPQLRDLNFVLIDPDQNTVRRMNGVTNHDTSCWHLPHHGSNTILRSHCTHQTTQPVAGSGIERGSQHGPNQQNVLVQMAAGDNVLAITMHAQSAVAASTACALSDQRLKSADTSHGFSFPTSTSSELNQGWGALNYPEDFLQLACIPVCAKNLGPDGGNPLAAGCSEFSGAGNGKSPEVFMERRAADRSNVPAHALSPVTRQANDTTACPVEFRWNTAEALLNRCGAEMSLNNLASTSPANSRNLSRKNRGRRHFHVNTSSSREPTFRNLLTACTGDSQMNDREFWQHRGRQGNKEFRRHRRRQPDLMYGHQYYPLPTAERAAVSESAEGIGDQESNFKKFLENMRILQDAAAVRPSEDSEKENSSTDKRAFEIQVSQAERQRRSLFGEGGFDLLEKNVLESHRRSFPSEDAPVRRQEKPHEAGPSEGALESGLGDGEQLIDVNQVPDEGEERLPEMKKWVEMLGQLHASERRCQSLLLDNQQLRQLNLSLKEKMAQLAQNYKSMISENSSLLEKLHKCRNHELGHILDACNKLG